MTFDIDTGVGTLRPAGDRPVDFAGIQAAVRDSGFELLWIEARVRGTLRTRAGPDGEERAVLEVERPRQRFLVVEGKSEGERAAWARLSEAARGREVRVAIRGRVHPHPGAPPGLTVLDFRIES